jgi:ectoine hydroxylase-related dioxygenase (phytanoyl-CoA dioxygenase family)
MPLSRSIWMSLLVASAATHCKHFARAFASRSSSLRSTRTITLQKSTSTVSVSLSRRTIMSAMPANAEANGFESVKDTDYPIEMTEDERYLFDLNGYLIVRGVFSPEEVKEANDMIDKHSEDMIERKEVALRNAVRGTKLYGTGPGRKDLGQVLEWGSDSKIFKSILAHPRLVPLFHGILGKGYRLDHLPFVIAQDEGAEGFQLHGGTVDCTSGEYNPHLAYTCHHGMIRSALMGCTIMLTDHNAGDGGFCIVPGSHKSNFKMPPGMVDGDKYEEFIRQPTTKAGDVVLFSEGTVHGAMAWTPEDRQRRVCLYRFAPATNVYARSYFGHEGGGWPKAMYEDLTDAQMAVLEPPYANRLDRPNIHLDGSIEVTTRNERKKQHDRELFGTKYF